MAAFVIDANVPIVANGHSPQANPECRLACIRALIEARKGIVCIDDRDLILCEYRQYLSQSGQPGVGDEFMQWLFNNQYNEDACERVSITDSFHEGLVFVEFPTDQSLSGFDRSDRKYVAVALKSRMNPTILNAVDSDWHIYEALLKDKGLKIRQLCPDCLS